MARGSPSPTGRPAGCSSESATVARRSGRPIRPSRLAARSMRPGRAMSSWPRHSAPSAGRTGRAVERAQLAGRLRDGARLAITDGAAGGVLVRVRDGGPAERQTYPAIPTGGEVDATGAGDVFLASLLSAVLGSDRGDGWPTVE